MKERVMRCMRPIRPKKAEDSLPGGGDAKETIRLCGAPASWKVSIGEEKIYVCNDCKESAVASAPEGATLEAL